MQDLILMICGGRVQSVSKFLYALLAATLLSLAPGCRSGFGAEGATCETDSACDAPMACIAGTCRTPGADPDGDGLSNAAEALLGTDPERFDTDGDGLGDGEEGDVDSDGDGILDALESAVADEDLDCLADQNDPDNFQAASAVDVAAQLCAGSGVCATTDAAVVQCVHRQEQGRSIVTTRCDYGVVPGYESVEVSCDGLDNDCDGLVDEALALASAQGNLIPLGQPCRGIGACSEHVGTVECAADGGLVCSVNAGGSASKGAPEGGCDGVDDDCNGVTDDGKVWVAPTTKEALPVGASCEGRGVCGVGVVECADPGAPPRCSTEPGGSEDQSLVERCDALDNDCDGQTDEGLVYVQPDGSERALNSACGVGRCSGGVVQCVGGEATCSTAALAEVGEWCNGEDDDCDGQVDEAPSLALNCPQSETGVCNNAIPISATCELGLAPVCGYSAAGGWQVQETLCDGLDNDCDGSVDEDIAWQDADGTSVPLGATCFGTGVCSDPDADGVVTCEDGLAACSANFQGGGVELCNGVDDDCDGAIDEVDPELPGGGVCKTLGVCAEFVSTLPGCADGTWICGYDQAASYEAIETLCDGLDNDCDGLTDENAAKAFSGPAVSFSPGQPSTRTWDTSAVSQGVVWQAGGLFDQRLPLADVWRYDASAVSWVSLESLPTPVGGAATAFSHAHQALLVHGGITEATATSDPAPLLAEAIAPVQAMRIFDLATGSWAAVTQQVASALPVGEITLARAFHAMCSLPDGRIVISGGRTAAASPTEVNALVGTLTSSGGNGWSISWEPLASQPASRVAHRLVCLDLDGPTVLAVGGIGSGGTAVNFVEGLRVDATPAVWTHLATPPTGSTQRLQVAAALDESTSPPSLLIHGGFAAPSPDALEVSEVLAGGWRLPLPATLTPTSWTPQEVWAALPAQGGGALVREGEQWHRVGGNTAAGFTWRRTWIADASSVAPQLELWRGITPRVGGVLVTAAKTGATYLLGGALNAQGTIPLQDAHVGNSPTVGFSTKVHPSPPLPGAATNTRPALAFASGLWDPVAQRVLLVGGSKPDGTPSQTLWSYSADSFLFSPADAQGQGPAAAFRPIVALDPSDSVAWVYGAHLEAPSGDDPWSQAPFAGTVWSLDLSNSTWTAVEPISGPEPSGTRAAGGVSGDGLDAAVLAGDALELWRFDLATFTWSMVGGPFPLPEADPPSGVVVTPLLHPSDRLGAFVYDRLSRTALVTIHTPGPSGAQPASLWVVDFAQSTFKLRDAALPIADGAAMALHPSLGLLSMGGAGPVATSVGWRVEQACLDAAAN